MTKGPKKRMGMNPLSDMIKFAKGDSDNSGNRKKADVKEKTAESVHSRKSNSRTGLRTHDNVQNLEGRKNPSKFDLPKRPQAKLPPGTARTTLYLLIEFDRKLEWMKRFEGYGSKRDALDTILGEYFARHPKIKAFKDD